MGAREFFSQHSHSDGHEEWITAQVCAARGHLDHFLGAFVARGSGWAGHGGYRSLRFWCSAHVFAPPDGGAAARTQQFNAHFARDYWWCARSSFLGLRCGTEGSGNAPSCRPRAKRAMVACCARKDGRRVPLCAAHPRAQGLCYMRYASVARQHGGTL